MEILTIIGGVVLGIILIYLAVFIFAWQFIKKVMKEFQKLDKGE